MTESRQQAPVPPIRLLSMPLTIPKPLRPAAAVMLTSFPTTVRVLATSQLPASQEMAVFLRALATVPDDAPTACAGWSSHDVVAHLAAGSQEMGRLVGLRLELGPGVDIGPTRACEEREAPFLAMRDEALRRRFLIEAFALTDLVLKLHSIDPRVTVTFTGWDMTAEELVRHGRSELAIHRWDLVGTDRASRELLSHPELLDHGRKVLTRMGIDVTVKALSPPADDFAALLALWGRDPEWRAGTSGQG